MADLIENLILALSAAPVAADCFNQYAPPDPNNARRRHNLRLYLEKMSALKPSSLLVMEAPGYRGCRLTGIPVTSPAMLMGAHPLGWFGAANGYQLPQDQGFEDVRGEQSATILWQTLADLQAQSGEQMRPPLIWNSYPFHPHQPDNPRSNRAPRKREIAQGLGFLETILKLFTPETIVAVGNTAAGSLTTLDVPHTKIRHPAQGGKNAFVAGMRAVFGNENA